jgi:hypothetical protein
MQWTAPVRFAIARQVLWASRFSASMVSPRWAGCGLLGAIGCFCLIEDAGDGGGAQHLFRSHMFSHRVTVFEPSALSARNARRSVPLDSSVTGRASSPSAGA